MLTNFNRLCKLAILLNEKQISVSPIYKDFSPTGTSFDHRNINPIMLVRQFNGAIGMKVIGGTISNNLEWIRISTKNQPDNFFWEKFNAQLKLELQDSYKNLSISKSKIGDDIIYFIVYHCESIKPKMIAQRTLKEEEKNILFEKKKSEYGSIVAANEFVEKNSIKTFVESFSDGKSIDVDYISDIVTNLKKVSDLDRNKLNQIITSYNL
jgi:hypothetical protein